ncbi:MAG: SPFH domain-containing protein [Cytophagaceae bacterium]|jgi:hypothetical protein|nr:SPFH domain-containing protein [Cytophagaceae bacterium]
MFGINYIKFDSNKYVIHYSNGKIKQEGKGLAFFYFAPSSSIMAIPVGSSDFQFIFNVASKDFQSVSVQGQITYKIENPKQLSELLDFTVDERGMYKSNDFEKVSQRLINEAQTATSSFIGSLTLKEALKNAKGIEECIGSGLKAAKSVEMLGVVPLSVTILGISPSPEMARALEAETREALQQEADQAIYQRRNFAVEQERKIKESELNTEIAVQEKQKQISEKKMETEVLQEQNNRKLREMKMQADIKVEEQRTSLIDLQVTNEKKMADSKAYAIKSSIEPYTSLDWKTVMALTNQGDASRLHMAIAFRELAENAQKINTLNISPDLVEQLLQQKK